MPTSRRAVLVIMVIGFVPAFAATGALVRSDRAYLNAEAARWRREGVADLAAHRPDAAVEAFRVTIARGGDDASVRLQLAEALIAAGRRTEAESHLRTLWADAPGDGTVNLALARLAVQSGRITDAIRYYHAAVDGAWEAEPLVSRRNARLELARMLLQQGRNTEARSELIVLADAVKDDPDQTLGVAHMLVEAGDPRTALTLARRVVTARPDDVEALTLAGDLLFRNASYMEARDLLERAARAGTLPVDAQSELRDADAALALDPMAPRLGPITRLARLRMMLAALRQRIDSCLMAAGAQPPPDLQALSDRAAELEHSVATARRAGADDLDEAMAITSSVGQLSDTLCGPSSPSDRTLRLIARAHPAQ